jgi:hypothetical protein
VKAFKLAAAFVVIIGAAITIMVSVNKESSPIGDGSEMLFPGRYSYQQTLNESSQRFAPELSLIVIEDRLYERTDRPRTQSLGACDIRCGTISGDNDVVSVSLPVGYVHGNNVSPMPTAWKPVTELTFWDPVSHLKASVTSDTTSKGVSLPDFLLQYLSASDLKPGETAYTTANHVRRDSSGKTYMFSKPLAYEMLGSKYGYTLDTTVTAKPNGKFEVRLPSGVKPLDRDITSSTNIVPVKIVS